MKSARTDKEFFWACGLSAMFLFILIDAGSHEVMHYRHVWIAFVLIAVQAKLWNRPAPEASPSWMPEPGTGTYRTVLATPVPRLGRSTRS